MHTCPACGQCCDCSGDIDDADVMTHRWVETHCVCCPDDENSPDADEGGEDGIDREEMEWLALTLSECPYDEELHAEAADAIGRLAATVRKLRKQIETLRAEADCRARDPAKEPPLNGQIVIFEFDPLPYRGYELRDSRLYLGRYEAPGDRVLGTIFQTDLGPFFATCATAWWPVPPLPEPGGNADRESEPG